MNISWSDQARRDLCAIRDFIARDSEHYAHLQLERLILEKELEPRMNTDSHG